MSAPEPKHDPSYQPSNLELGSIGWDDSDDYFDLDSSGGPAFVKVQLFRGGRDIGQTAKAGAGMGAQVLCRVMGPLFVVPSKGSIVLVAFPGGFVDAPGAGIILGQVSGTPSIQFSDTKAKLDLGDSMDLVIKARSITLSDYPGSTTYSRYVVIGPDNGILLQDETGSGLTIKQGAWFALTVDGGMVIIQQSGVTVGYKGSGLIQTDNAGTITLSGNTANIATGNIGLGVAPTPACPVLLGPTGQSGIGSTCIFGTP